MYTSFKSGGINHAYDDDDSWKLNMSDDGDEPWEGNYHYSIFI